MNISYILSGRNLILHKITFCDLTIGIVGNIFVECHTDSLTNATLRLYSCQIGIDRNSAVNHCIIIQDLHTSGLFIQLDLCHADHIGRRRYWR